MAEKTLIARVRNDEREPETLIVTAPIVGMADGAPRVGVFLNAFDRVIAMKVLNQRYVLRLPREVQGRITEVLIPNEYTPVAYDQPLVHLDPRALSIAGQARAAAGGAQPAAGETAGENVITMSAPTEGIFYRRSSPDSPAYVEVGNQISTGAVLGLVEVMKCFNQITYGGPGLPERGEVVKILAEDVSEVQFGQPLFWIKPIE
jgi:acetyl-CoA carboxylase biotin carboxyl carrier protein